nr:N-acetyltransferase [Beijerinckia indica]
MPATIRIEEEGLSDVPAREALLDRAFGPARFEKTSERLREGRYPAIGLSLVAKEIDERGETLVGTVRLWHVLAGLVPCLLLGPLAVSPEHRSLGLGGRLMREAIARARSRDHAAILLVGDAPYYEKFGFSSELTKRFELPGPVDRARFLALELSSGALANAEGLVLPTGALLFPSAQEPILALDWRQAA